MVADLRPPLGRSGRKATSGGEMSRVRSQAPEHWHTPRRWRVGVGRETAQAEENEPRSEASYGPAYWFGRGRLEGAQPPKCAIVAQSVAGRCANMLVSAWRAAAILAKMRLFIHSAATGWATKRFFIHRAAA